MDLIDDSWTYSDPSVESLLVEDNRSIVSTNKSRRNSVTTANATRSSSLVLESPIALRELKIQQQQQQQQNSLFPENTIIISAPPKPITMSAPSPVLIPPKKNKLNTLSATEASVESSKSAPANPFITKHDANSEPVLNSGVSSVTETVSDLAQLQGPSTPTMQSNGGFFNSMMTTLSLNNNNNDSNTSQTDPAVTIGSEGRERSESASTDTGASPNIISYRKSKMGKRRQTSTGSTDSPLSPLAEEKKPFKVNKIDEESFNVSQYVDEKFKDTNYRYATESRNKDFHKIFKSIPEDERLLDDFSCALSREILLQGRIYVTEKNICFNSNLLGWVTTLVIPFSDVTGLEKTATAGLFNNGIAVSTKTDGKKHSFATFLSRDSTYEFIETVRKANTGEVDKMTVTQEKDFGRAQEYIPKDLMLGLEEYEEYNSALMSIDGDTPRPPRRSCSESTSNIDEEDDDDDDDDDSETSDSSNQLQEPKLSNEKVFKFREDSGYTYEGPYAHPPTSFNYDHQAKKETILARENFKCPPGILYELLFGTKNDFTLEFLKSQDGKDFSEFSDYVLNDEKRQERTYDYTKGLNFSVGPKSTKCLVSETIEHFGKDGYINVINTTQTPDVPSGKAFQVKTRYIITWGLDNTCDVIVSFWVQWTGSSWMKTVIEKSCKSGQESATRSLVSLLREYVSLNTIEQVEEVSITAKDTEPVEILASETVVSEVKKAESVRSELPLDLSPFNIMVLALLVIVVTLQLLILNAIKAIPKRTSPLDFIEQIEPIEKKAQDILFNGEEILIWNWIDERAGRIKGSSGQKTNVLKDEIDELVNKWALGELNSKEGKALMQNFEHHLNEYTLELSSSEGKQVQKKRAEALKAAIKALL